MAVRPSLASTRESGIFNEPPLPPLNPSNAAEDSEKKVDNSGQVAEAEKLFVPMDLARSRIALLSKELQDMKASHVMAIDNITAKYEAIQASSRDQWIATFDKLKLRANEKVRDSKLGLQALQVKFNEVVTAAKTREERLLNEISEFKVHSAPGNNIDLLSKKHEAENKMYQIQEQFEALQKENAELRKLSQQASGISADLPSPTRAGETASGGVSNAELARRAAIENDLREQLRQQLETEQSLRAQLLELKHSKTDAEMQFRSTLARLEMDRDQRIKESARRIEELEMEVAGLDANVNDPDGRYSSVKALLDSERESHQNAIAQSHALENTLRDEIEQYKAQVRAKQNEIEVLQQQTAHAAAKAALAPPSPASPRASIVQAMAATPPRPAEPSPKIAALLTRAASISSAYSTGKRATLQRSGSILSSASAAAASPDEPRAHLSNTSPEGLQRELDLRVKELAASAETIRMLKESIDQLAAAGSSGGASDLVTALQKNSQLTIALNEKQIELDNKIREADDLAKTVDELRLHLQDTTAHHAASSADLEGELLSRFKNASEQVEAEHSQRLEQLQAQLAQSRAQFDTVSAEASETRSKLADESARRTQVEQQLATTKSSLDQITHDSAAAFGKIKSLTEQVEQRDATLTQRDTTIADQKGTLDRNEKEIAALNFKLRAESDRRKKMQFEYEAIKGKIRVYARVRPFSTKEKNEGEDLKACIRPGLTEWDLELNNPRKNIHGVFEDNWNNYTLDHVFLYSRNGTQSHVFEETKGFCELACNGINSCIFAYGQSGTGKTWTMAGAKVNAAGAPTPENIGIKPRSIDEVYRIADEMKAQFTYKISSYMVEIYLNKLEDLYWKLSVARQGAGNKKLEAQPIPPELKVRVGQGRKVVIDNVDIRTFATAEELHDWSDEAEQLRRVRATGLNEQSSRSHLIFALIIEQTDIKTKKVKYGKLSLVDLAGSERAEKTNVDGLSAAEREAMLKEGLAINQSLTMLKNVFRVLGEKSGVDADGKQKSSKELVQYRGNQLTELLQDSLGGASRTLMFVNVGPAQSNVNESIDSLSYGNLVSNISNEVASADQDVVAENKHLREELEELKAKLARLGQN